MLLPSIAVLAAANVLNNRVAPRLAPLTSAVATAVLVAMARRDGVSWRELGFDRGRRGAAVGGVLAAGVAAVYTAGVAIPRTREFFHDERALSLTRARVLEEALLQVPVGTVLLEEVGFRGALYGMLRRTHGTATATAVSSALFGLWHILPAIDMARANPAFGALAAGEAPGQLDAVRAAGRPGTARVVGEATSGQPGTAPVEAGEASGQPDTAHAVAGEVPTRPDTAHAVAGEAPMQPDMAQVAVVEAGAGEAASRLETARVVVGSVVSTAAAGVFFCELRRRAGLLAPTMLHLSTNSLGYLFARLAGKRARDAHAQPVRASDS
ncbi:CPBP family intramembrane glutamic endopeptidase [Nonomuraea sp. NPDC000554]|uniref:CPBP family intramembrane glutamic endopeptidase n=1 Tax=Nonomuraea sp. NPDC000554 TaxID=3154259 RepID=UPI00332B612E